MMLHSPEARAYAAEALGTYLLVFAGPGAVVINAVSEGGVGSLGISLSFGLVVMIVIFALGHISGAHINPAVTLAFATFGSFPWRHVPGYFVAQLLGAAAAAFTLRALFGNEATLGSTIPTDGAGQALFFGDNTRVRGIQFEGIVRFLEGRIGSPEQNWECFILNIEKMTLETLKLVSILGIWPWNRAFSAQGVETSGWLARRSNVHGHELELVQLLNSACPGSAFVEIRTDDQRCISQRIDQLVALHGVANVEPCTRIVGRNQYQLAIEQQVAVLAVHSCLFQAVCQNTADLTTRVKCATHGSLVDAFGAA